MVFLDQSLFAFFNFCTIFFLSKTAGIVEFSSFVLFQSSIFFVFVFCTFFLSSPILVLHTKHWNKTGNEYLKVLVSTNLFINLTLSVGLYYFLKQQEINVSYFFVFSIPFIMSLYDIFKKYMLSNLNVNLVHCVISTIILNAVFFSSLIIHINSLNLSLILTMYLASFTGANFYLVLVFFVKRKYLFYKEKIRSSKWDLYKAILNNHFIYSKWIIIGGVAFWGYNQGIFIFSKILGAEDIAIGKIRTIQNLLGVTNILLASVENVYTPLFSKFIAENPKDGLHSLVKDLYLKNYTKIIFLAILAFCFATIFYELLYYELYGSGFWIILFFAINQTLLFAIRPMVISLKSIEVTRPFFYAHLIALTVMLLSGFIFIVNYHFSGMATAYILSNVTFTIVVIYFYKVKLLDKKTILNN